MFEMAPAGGAICLLQEQYANVVGDDILGEIVMEFFLRYQGPLPTCSGRDKRTKEKDHIRRKISPQLQDLWESHPGL